MSVTTPRYGLSHLAVESIEADQDQMALAFAWADEKPDERGYPHLIAAFLSVIRACETVRGGRE